MTAAIDLARLPPPSVIEPLEYEAILADLTADLIARAPELTETLTLESEPLTKLLEVCAYRELLLRQRVNDGARAVLLAHASGADLEHLAALTQTERLPGEGDAALRQRAQLAWESLSVAGPIGAYRYHALSAHPDVAAASIDSPTPGTVRVTILARSGDGTPSAEVLAAVEAHLRDDDVRPLTDTVLVEPVSVIPYTITAALTLYPGPSAAPVLSAAQAAVEAEVVRLHAPGHDITRSALFAALHQPGVMRVDLHAPMADLIVGETEAAYCADIDITLAGRAA